mgnify:CR=1 FL=1
MPDELATINKWEILQILIPGLTNGKVKTQMKNYGKLKTDNMLFMCIDTIVRMFLTICYLDDRENTDTGQIKTRSFKHLVKMKIEEIEELEKELYKVKNDKGVVNKADHKREIKELTKEVERLTEENEKHSDRLKQQEEFYKEKWIKRELMLRKQIEFEFQCKQSEKNSTD